MSVIGSREEFMSRINTFVGDRNDDDALSFIEDITDTYNNFSNRDIPDAESINAEWQQKYDALDNDWRNKYKNRFMNGSNDNNDNDNPLDKVRPPKPNDNPDNIQSFEDLFK